MQDLLGYNGNPALTETIASIAYLAIVGWLLFGRRTVLAL
jgi:hypothetical protein